MSQSTQLARAMSLAVPGQNLDAYIRSVNSVDLLTPEEEKSLAIRFYENDDIDAARQLVLAHLRYVVHVARGYTGYGLPMADLIQEGNVGLMKAVKRFDPSVGVRLVSFAVHWIKAEIHDYVLKNWRIVKVATTKAQRKLFFNLRSQKKSLGQLSPDETHQVAHDLGVSDRDVREMEGRLTAWDAPFDAPQDDNDDRPQTAPQYFLKSESEDPADLLEKEDWHAHHSNRLARALHSLDERSRDIVEKRWLADSKTTLHDLASYYGVSAERIRQLEKNAMKKLKAAMAA